MKKLILSFSLFSSALFAVAAPSILTLKQSITDDAIVYPESFETDTHKMMQNWYLQNYTVLNDNFAKVPTIDASDEVYIKRLASLPTDIEMPYNQIVRSYINMYTQRRRELVESMLGMSLYYMPIFEQALERHGLPLELRYLPVIESALNPDAVSRVGATGLWQFMLPTARGLGLEISTLVDERRDPYASSEAAAVYLKQLFGMYNDWSLAIAAYNCGPGNVNKALRRAGDNGKDFWSIYYLLPAETRGYVPAFIAANYVMTYYNQHNISPALARRPIITDSIHINKRVHFKQIADVLNLPVEEIRVLNPQYRKDIIPGDVRPYSLVLPSMQVYSYIMSEDSILSRDSKLYARRNVVEPQMGPVEDPDAEYTTKLVVVTHKVRKGETLSTIAKKYGVTTSEIKKWNKMKKSRINTGRKLKIHTYQRVATGRKKSSDEELASTSSAVDAACVNNDTVSSSTPSVAAAPEPAKNVAKNTKPKTEKKVSAKKAKTSGSYTYHTVKKGESLYRIAQKYKGVSIKDLQEANGMGSKTALREGQKIKIPRI
ncbi:MAG TPA: LysM peptidoglycan-binding domain-containing protein [Muribaculum sp.]|jgi:membrane-bound lytic murein transglycosylase D|uniref:LysM peptidoglycan-binding domain-containing protein n=1 Tax=Heminiphilus faecis TaxID=2601703 RepID=A0ABV4CTX8_9BACT|nr:LysM peptidoglycan-binding domain-containing protein [Heminiphilus faecis]RLT75475.1 LysM peptidoglycan-binding domain-containing protein [bacterium J10(2018)]HRF68431.1 LysM peptidoglycan-binding domain-containing protein [Muribaculum sp.]